MFEKNNYIADNVGMQMSDVLSRLKSSYST